MSTTVEVFKRSQLAQLVASGGEGAQRVTELLARVDQPIKIPPHGEEVASDCYLDGTRTAGCSGWPSPSDCPSRLDECLEEMIADGRLQIQNNAGMNKLKGYQCITIGE